jgi:uncharacterized membrane protein (DUF2068 family)
MATNSRFVIGSSRSSRNSRTMNAQQPGHIPKILEPQRSVRYLKLIAVFKIAKGVLLSIFGVSILILHSRDVWMDKISDWIDAEILLGHSHAVMYLLNKLQEVMAGGRLRAAGYLMLFYCGVLLTEGIGVYLQQRWAEFLMIVATGALIPLEVRHLWHRPSAGAAVIVAANLFIVWFLYRILKRDRHELKEQHERELVETR